MANNNVSSMVQTIIQGILAAVSAAPQVEAVITGAKALIAGLVEAKMISTDVQNALRAFCDTQAKLAAIGVTPIAWTVEPNPPISSPPVA